MANDDNNNEFFFANSDDSMEGQFAKLGKKLTTANYMNLVEKTEAKNYLADADHIKDVFKKCYNTTSATQIYTYRTLEKDFRQIENEEDESNGIVEFFKRVDLIKNFPANLKAKQVKIAIKINQMKKNILESYKNVLMALESGDEQWVADIIKKMDLAVDIDGCQELIDELDVYIDSKRECLEVSLPCSIVAPPEFKKDLQSSMEKINILKGQLDKEENELLQLNSKLSKQRASKNYLTYKHEQKKEAIAYLENEHSTLLGQLEKLKKQAQENVETKVKCYKKIIELKNNQDYELKNRKAREGLEKKHLEYINSMKTMCVSVLNELTKSTVINKLFHSIFLLDESGSMAPYFNTVTTKVYKILKNRKEKGRNDEKVSIIKFNTDAEFDVISVSVKSDIKISKLRGGGTSFLKPLEKLEELLQQINADLFIPIIFFLSNGFGEAREPVVNYCKRIKAAHSKMDFLFFSVGYGADADKETLESMAKTFNNDLSILKIGSEMVRLYHNVENEEHLTNVFSLYEKLFNYQMNLANQKMELIDTFLKNAQDNHINELAALEETLDMNKKKRDRDLKEAEEKMKDSTLNIDEINLVYTKRFEEIENKVKRVESLLDENCKEKVDAERDLSIVNAQIEEDDVNFKNAKEKYDQTREKYLIDDESEQHREKFLTYCINAFKELGMSLNDEQFFKDTYSSFLHSYSQFDNWKEKYKASIDESSRILNDALENFRVINEKFQGFRVIFKRELGFKMWEIVEIYASYTYGLDRQNDNCEFFDKIMSKCLKFGEDDTDEDSPENRCIKAFNLITDNLPLCSIFSNFETDEKFLKNFQDFAQNKIYEIKDEIRQERKDIEKISKNEASNETEKKKAMERLEKLENHLDEYNDYKREISKVSNLMLDLRSKAKSAFLIAILKEQLLVFLKDFIDKDATIVKALDGIKAIEINSKSCS